MLSNAPVCPTLPVVNMERAKKFYTEVLGLKEAAKSEPGGINFECGKGTMLYIYERSTPTLADNTACSFDVADLVAEMADLKSRGVVFEEYDFPGLKTVNGVAEMGGYKAAWFKDPDGNILAIGQSA